jgi:chromosome segregation ATPase
MKRIVAIAMWIGLCASASGLHAQQQSLEEQLRAQLRDTRSQLQDLQNQQAQWQGQKTALEQERDQAKKALEQAQAELAKTRGTSPALAAQTAAEKAGREKAQEEAKQAQAAFAQASNQAKQQDARNTALTTQLGDSQKQIEACTAKNEQLYKVGLEVLDAYSHMDMHTMMSARQPFAASARVKLDNAAQAYGDRMYEQRYDPRTTPAKQP